MICGLNSFSRNVKPPCCSLLVVKYVFPVSDYCPCLRQLKELLNTYYPIEIDSSRSVEEKLPLMVEW